MNVWAWFALPPAILLAAHYALEPLEKTAVTPLPPPPTIETLHLPPVLSAATGAGAYQRGGAPKAIQLAAFGIAVPIDKDKGAAEAVLPVAGELFALQSVLVAGGRRSATIDGRIFEEGSKLGCCYQLAKVEADAVLLEGPRGQEVLRFAEFRDPPPRLVAAATPPPAPGAKPALPPGAPAKAGVDTNQLDSEYRKILEMLKL